MARPRGRSTDCDATERAARLAKAEEFMEAADLIDTELPDAHVSLCVLAGIAASDIVCCAKHLAGLLSLKSKAGYSSQRLSAASSKQAGRAANALLEAARLVT